MTDQIYDDRAAAYVGAREALKAANQIKSRYRSTVYDGTPESEIVDGLPADYWSLMAEAGVLAQLARADVSVGLLAGNYLVDQNERIHRNKRRRYDERVHATIQEAAKRAADVTTHDHHVGTEPPFHQGHRVRVFRGEHTGRAGEIVETRLSQDEPGEADVLLEPDDARKRGFERLWFSFNDLELLA